MDGSLLLDIQVEMGKCYYLLAAYVSIRCKRKRIDLLSVNVSNRLEMHYCPLPLISQYANLPYLVPSDYPSCSSHFFLICAFVCCLFAESQIINFVVIKLGWFRTP